LEISGGAGLALLFATGAPIEILETKGGASEKSRISRTICPLFRDKIPRKGDPMRSKVALGVLAFAVTVITGVASTMMEAGQPLLMSLRLRIELGSGN
jgi:hypothetical protein